MKQYKKTVYNIASKLILPIVATGMALGIGCNKADRIGQYDGKQVRAIYKELDELEAQSRAIDKYCTEVVDPLLAQAEADRMIDEEIRLGRMPKRISDKTIDEILEEGLNQPPQPDDEEILKLYGLSSK